MDILQKDVSHDLELDALMMKVREAAMAGGTGRVTSPPQTAGDQTGPELDLVRVIDAQGEWNEHTTKSLAAVVECLRSLRDDWEAAHSRICQDVERLSAVLDQMHLLDEKKERRKATRRRVPVKRRQPRKANGHRS